MNTVIQLKLVHRVHIIESMGKADINRGENHSQSLSNALQLIGIEVFRYSPSGKNEFSECFDRIGKENVTHGTVPVPYIHILSHGFSDGSGLALGSGEDMSWSELGECFRRLNEPFGLSKEGNNSMLIACMSSCNGLQARLMPRQYGKCPFSALIAPSQEISWSDSLTAFITFYHLMIEKEYHACMAVEVMNYAAGFLDEPIFQLVTRLDIKEE